MINPNIQTFEEKEDWIQSAVSEILSDISDDAEFSIAFSGGSTPAPVYERLSEQQKQWKNCDIFQVDERYIAPEKLESNAFLILHHFVLTLPEPVRNLYFFETTGHSSWEESAEKYNELLEAQKKPLDVCILGIGPDGHTASLFPNGPELNESNKYATTSETNMFPVWKRLTMTFPYLLMSEKIIILLKGKEKKEILHELVSGEKTQAEFPAKRLLEHQNLHIIFYNSKD